AWLVAGVWLAVRVLRRRMVVSVAIRTDERVPLARQLVRAVPFPAGARMARMLVERKFRSFRRTWSIIVSGFFEPVFFLFAMGVGIGAMVGDIDLGDGRTVPYGVFVAPALLASSAMNGAVFD